MSTNIRPEHVSAFEALTSGEHSNFAPETFATVEEAQAALDEFFAEIAEEIAAGQRPADNGYDREKFRIVAGGAS